MKRFSSLLLAVVFLVFSSVSAEELGIFHRGGGGGAAAALGVAERSVQKGLELIANISNHLNYIANTSNHSKNHS